jgi:hypothetical protein
MVLTTAPAIFVFFHADDLGDAEFMDLIKAAYREARACHTTATAMDGFVASNGITVQAFARHHTE